MNRRGFLRNIILLGLGGTVSDIALADRTNTIPQDILDQLNAGDCYGTLQIQSNYDPEPEKLKKDFPHLKVCPKYKTISRLQLKVGPDHNLYISPGNYIWRKVVTTY